MARGHEVTALVDEPKVVDRVFGLLLRTLQRDVLDWVVVRGPRLAEGRRAWTESSRAGQT